MIHRRALITGLLASVAAPVVARLAPPASDIFADGRLYFGKGDWVTIASLDIQSEVPLPCGWQPVDGRLHEGEDPEIAPGSADVGGQWVTRTCRLPSRTFPQTASSTEQTRDQIWSNLYWALSRPTPEVSA